MEGSGVNGMARHMLSPVVEGHTPGVRAVVGSKAGEALRARLEAEPAAVLLTHGAVRRFDLRMMKNRFAEDQIAIRRPGKIVQRVMRILGPEPRQHATSQIRLPVAVGVFQER